MYHAYATTEMTRDSYKDADIGMLRSRQAQTHTKNVTRMSAFACALLLVLVTSARATESISIDRVLGVRICIYYVDVDANSDWATPPVTKTDTHYIHI